MTIALFGSQGTTLLLDGVEIDGRLSESHTYGSEPTKFAIENGALASDHIVEMPDIVEVEFAMSNVDGFGSSYGTRAGTMLETLHSRVKARELFQIVTRHRLYTSMAIVGVRAANVAPFSGGLKGIVSFQEVPTVTLQRAKLPEEKIPAPRKKTGSGTVNAGRVDSKTPTAEEKTNAEGKVTGSVFGQIFL